MDELEKCSPDVRRGMRRNFLLAARSDYEEIMVFKILIEASFGLPLQLVGRGKIQTRPKRSIYG